MSLDRRGELFPFTRIGLSDPVWIRKKFYTSYRLLSAAYVPHWCLGHRPSQNDVRAMKWFGLRPDWIQTRRHPAVHSSDNVAFRLSPRVIISILFESDCFRDRSGGRDVFLDSIIRHAHGCCIIRWKWYRVRVNPFDVLKKILQQNECKDPR